MTEHDDTPGDPALSRRYREAGDQEGMAPSPALDAHILAAARAAVVPQKAAQHQFPRPWWRRLALPVGAMATVALAVMLSLTLQRHAPETQEGERWQAKTPTAPADASVPVLPDTPPPHPPAPAATRADRAPPAVAVQAERSQRTERAQRTERTERPPRAAEKKAVEQSVAPAAPAALPAPPSASPPTPAAPTSAVANETGAAASRLKAESTADHSRESDARAPQQKAVPAAAAQARPGAAGGEAATAAQAWIDEIRELKRQGREEAAARRLAEFRKAYPGYVLPDDLK